MSDQEAEEDADQGPAAGPAQSRGVRSRLVGRVEVIGGAVRQQVPGGGEVACRVARAQGPEVDDAAEGAVAGEDVGGVQVGVEPQRRAVPGGCGDGVLPDRTGGVRVRDQAQTGGFGKLRGEAVGVVGEWSAGARRCSGRGGAVKGGEEGRQGPGGCGAGGGCQVGGGTRDPEGDGPGAGEPVRGLAQPLRHGDGQREAGREGGQPGVFLAQQIARPLGRPGQPDGQVVAEPPQLVVPAAGTQAQRAVREVGVLLAQQITDQFGGDPGVREGHALHGSQVAVRAGRWRGEGFGHG